eukprot:gene2872-3136_t
MNRSNLYLILLLFFPFASSLIRDTSFGPRMKQLRFFLSAKRRGATPDDYEIHTSEDYLGVEDRPYLIGNKPDSGFNLALQNFRKELGGIFTQATHDAFVGNNKVKIFPETLKLHLSNEAVKQAELEREMAGGVVKAHPVSRALYDLGCLFLDRFFDQRPIERFWFLETVARIPYFVYVSMLHLYESLGWWREPSLRSVHNAEEWNELHHLLIMETLGGDKRWSDRFLGYHAAVLYYWLLIVTYLCSPRIAYQFMELLEAHAVDTYGTFLQQNEDRLKELPAPDVAVSYYTGEDLYHFDEFMASRAPGSRRPPCDNLYDVFANIRDDENEHVATMKACQDYSRLGKMVVSPHQRFTSRGKGSISLQENDGVAKEKERRRWSDWASEINQELTQPSPASHTQPRPSSSSSPSTPSSSSLSDNIIDV